MPGHICEPKRGRAKALDVVNARTLDETNANKYSILSEVINTNFINWFEYIPIIVYVLLCIPLGISLYLIFYNNKKGENIN